MKPLHPNEPPGVDNAGQNCKAGTKPSESTVSYLRNFQSPRLRHRVRSVTLNILAGFSGALGVSAWAQRARRIQFLYLHHVFLDEESGFRNLLALLSRTHSFLSYSDAISRIWDGNIDKPYVSISFDDGMRSCLRASEIMDEFGAKGCFFVCPSIVGIKDYSQLREFCGTRLRTPTVEFLDWDQILSMRSRGHEIGSHTLSHAQMSNLSAVDLENEVYVGKEMIEKHVGSTPHFAWPYGEFRHFSVEARDVVRRAGFASIASAVRGCHMTQCESDRLCVRRDHVVAGAPWAHVSYFLAQNVLAKSRHEPAWPIEFA